MPLLPLAKGRYSRRDNTPVRLVNAYYEQDPTNLRDQVSLISRPGMASFATLGGAYVAGMIRVEDADDHLLCVGGTNAYYVTAAGAVSAVGGGIFGASRVRMATDGSNVMIVRDGVLFVHDGSTATQVEMPDSAVVLDVVFLAARFWIATAFDGRIYYTVPGEVTVGALNYFSAESGPDGLVGLFVSGDELVPLGRSSVEYWTPTGDQDLPATRTLGRASKVGCASVHSIASNDVSAWVGDDNMVYRDGESLPVPIGDAGLAELIRKARPTLDETDPTKTMTGRIFAIEAHTFYVLDVPGYGTFAYDFTSTQWTELASHNRSLFAAGCGAKLSNGRWVVGGTYDNKLRLFTPDAHSDDGDPLVRIFPALLPVNSVGRINNVILECTVGAATSVYPTDNPKVGERHSRNGGHTWSDWLYAGLGQQGRYETRPAFKGLGRTEPPSQLFEFRFADPLPFTLRAARYNEDLR